MNKLFYEGSGEDLRSFYIQPSPMRELLLTKDTMSYSMLSTCTFIPTMKIYIHIKISLIWGKHIYTRTHAHKIKDMFVIKNYMHIEHRHTKCMGCLKQHNLTQVGAAHGDIYLYLRSWFHVTPKKDNI